MHAFRRTLLSLVLVLASPALAAAQAAPQPPAKHTASPAKAPAAKKTPAAAAKKTPAAAAKKAPATITRAWVREAPPGAAVMAGYMTIKNNSNKPLTLKGVKSPVFGEVQLHVLLRAGELVRMIKVPSFLLNPKITMKLGPGGQHLMLLKPKHPVRKGEMVPFVLDFGPDGTLAVKAIVRQPD